MLPGPVPPLPVPPGRALPQQVGAWVREHRKLSIGLGALIVAAIA
jgi:hypothetical protein